MLDKVNSYLLECDKEPVTIRTIQKDLLYLESLPHKPAPLGYSDLGRVRYYFYTDRTYELEAPAVSNDQGFALAMAAQVVRQLRGFPLVAELEQLRKRLEKQVGGLPEANEGFLIFEQNDQLKGIEWLEVLFDAIRAKTVVKLKYEPFGAVAFYKIIHPWWLKQFNQRWFLFGWNEADQRIDNSPLDRILSVSPISAAFIASEIPEPAYYFADIVGVTRVPGAVPQKILINVQPHRSHYLRTKPLHPSQLEISGGDETCQFQYDLIINKEWISLLLSFGADVEVLAPSELRKTVAEELRRSLEIYAENNS